MRDLLRLLLARLIGAGLLQWVLLVVLVVWVAFVALAWPGPPRPLLPPTLTGHPRAWFDCFDCRQGELDSLVALVGRKPGFAVSVLGFVVRHGPGAGDTAAFAEGLRRTYARTSAWLAVHDSTKHLPTEFAYVSERLRLFDRAWRVRAAIALGRTLEVAPNALARAGSGAALDAVCADSSQQDEIVLRQVIRARLAADSTASVVCLTRAHHLNILLTPGP